MKPKPFFANTMEKNNSESSFSIAKSVLFGILHLMQTRVVECARDISFG